MPVAFASRAVTVVAAGPPGVACRVGSAVAALGLAEPVARGAGGGDRDLRAICRHGLARIHAAESVPVALDRRGVGRVGELGPCLVVPARGRVGSWAALVEIETVASVRLRGEPGRREVPLAVAVSRSP